MPKSTLNLYPPEWVMYSVFLALTAAGILCMLIVGVGAQLICFILEPSIVIPNMRKTRETIAAIFHRFQILFWQWLAIVSVYILNLILAVVYVPLVGCAFSVLLLILALRKLRRIVIKMPVSSHERWQ